MNIDTLSIARDLKAAELPAGQAEAIAAAIGRSLTDAAATRGDLETLGSSLRADIAQLESRVETRLESLHVRLLTWFIGVQVAVGALIVALVKL